MNYFNFIDYEVEKYKYIGIFKEGLAMVVSQDNLTGFINKKGQEVIPCKYENVLDFSCGLAAVEIKGLGGFIDETGREVIPCQYKQVSPFVDGLAAFKGENNLWGFIDESGSEVINPQFIDVSKFKNGYAMGRKSNKEIGILTNKDTSTLATNGLMTLMVK